MQANNPYSWFPTAALFVWRPTRLESMLFGLVTYIARMFIIGTVWLTIWLDTKARAVHAPLADETT